VGGTYDVVIVGGGLVGCAVGRALALDGATVAVLEAEAELARHQSGRNSGVIHSGLYYSPGSHRARFTVEGRAALYRYLEEKGIAFERCGKLVVARDDRDVAALDELEPAVVGAEGLLVPETGIVDFAAVNRSYARDIEAAGGSVLLDTRFLAVTESGTGATLRTSRGELSARLVVNCAGLQADRIAHACGVATDLRIVPFRGDYYLLADERSSLVARPVYPVPDPVFPFLGVHLTPKLDGRIEAGPNAVLALDREGYRRTAVRLSDAVDALGFAGFWRLAARHWRVGLAELHRSFSKRAFARSLQELVPSVRAADLTAGGCGIRAQAMLSDGSMVDDFRIEPGRRTLHVLNTPSPAATASLAIGDHVAERVREMLG
jgi:L-2-hydroxyglutarate oxidase